MGNKFKKHWEEKKMLRLLSRYLRHRDYVMGSAFRIG